MNMQTVKPMTAKALAARCDLTMDVEGFDFGVPGLLDGFNGGTAYFEMDTRTLGRDCFGDVTEYENATLIGAVYYSDDRFGADLVLSRDDISAMRKDAPSDWEASALEQALGQ